jgi:hypothetical protein
VGGAWPAEEELDEPEWAEENEFTLVRRVKSSEWPEDDGWSCLLEPAGVDGRLPPEDERKPGEGLGEDPAKGTAGMLAEKEWFRSSLRAWGGRS